MIDDRDIFFQIFDREIDNLLRSFSHPLINMFSGQIKQYLYEMVEPYVNAFLSPSKKINTEVAGAYVKEELNNKINNFIEKFEKEKIKNNPNDYVV